MAKKDASGKRTLKYPWWLETLAAIGVSATLAVIITLFFAVGRRPGRLIPTQAPAVDAPEFIAAVAGTAGAPVLKGGTVHLLNNGVEIFPALLQALRAARHTITFSVYIWEAGQVSDQVGAALIDRARAGVQVRVLLDGIGAMKAPGETIEAMKKAGVKIETFRPVRFGKLMLRQPQIARQFCAQHRPARAGHKPRVAEVSVRDRRIFQRRHDRL